MGKIAMNDRQYKAQLRRLRRYKNKSKSGRSSGSGKKRKSKGGLKDRLEDTGAEKRKDLMRGKL